MTTAEELGAKVLDYARANPKQHRQAHTCWVKLNPDGSNDVTLCLAGITVALAKEIDLTTLRPWGFDQRFTGAMHEAPILLGLDTTAFAELVFCQMDKRVAVRNLRKMLEAV